MFRSGLESGDAKVKDFYRSDELKYHGKKNRGVLNLNFHEEVNQAIGSAAGDTLDFCGGEWKYPRTCSASNNDCEYIARWEFDENLDAVNFTITTTDVDHWTGIGFSDNPQMVNNVS